MSSEQPPKVVLVQKPVDGGRGLIGILECPHCGETHYTFVIARGFRNVFCGKTKHGKDIISRVEVVTIL